MFLSLIQTTVSIGHHWSLQVEHSGHHWSNLMVTTSHYKSSIVVTTGLIYLLPCWITSRDLLKTNDLGRIRDSKKNFVHRKIKCVNNTHFVQGNNSFNLSYLKKKRILFYRNKFPPLANKYAGVLRVILVWIEDTTGRAESISPLDVGWRHFSVYGRYPRMRIGLFSKLFFFKVLKRQTAAHRYRWIRQYLCCSRHKSMALSCFLPLRKAQTAMDDAELWGEAGRIQRTGNRIWHLTPVPGRECRCPS